MIDAELRLRTCNEALERVISFTRVADAKAAPILALHATLAGIALSSMNEITGLVDPDLHIAKQIAAWSTIVLYALTSGASWILAAFVYVPRTPRDEGSLLYFEEIRRLTVGEFQHKIQELQLDRLENQILRQVHAISGIASFKFMCVRWSFIATTIGLASWIAILLWARL